MQITIHIFFYRWCCKFSRLLNAIVLMIIFLSHRLNLQCKCSRFPYIWLTYNTLYNMSTFPNHLVCSLYNILFLIGTYIYIIWVRAMCDKSFSCRRYLLYNTTVIQCVSVIINVTYIRMKSAEVNTKSSY